MGSYRGVIEDCLSGWPVVPILEWLAKEGWQLPDSNELTQSLAIQMLAEQAPIVRLRLSVRDDTQALPGWSSIWQLGQAFEPDRVARPGFTNRSAYKASPIATVDESQAPYRVKLDAIDDTASHAILFELAAQGASDYYALPLTVRSIGLASIALVTDKIDGFNNDDILKFGVLASALAPVFEAVEIRRRSKASNEDDK